jgi:putative Holliday junction resolvase
MRIMGLDIGEKRIGVAVSDELEITSIPLEVYENDKNIISKIKDLITKYHIENIAVGLPYTLKGEIGNQAKKVISFVNDLKKDIEIDVDYMDERYTTKIPLKLLGKSNKDRKAGKKVDKFSAAIILSDYLQRRKKEIGNIK